MAHDACSETANAVFKRRAADWYWHSLALAAAVHFMVFALWPARTIAGESGSSKEIEILTIPELDIPPAPDEILKPAEPVPVEAAELEHVTVPGFADSWNSVKVEIPDVGGVAREVEERRWLLPDMVAPRLLNPAEVEQALQRTYPRLLRDAGIGGTVMMHVLIDVDGVVLAREIAETSGHRALDEAAAEVAALMRFSPALNRMEPVGVWVAIPVKFTAR